METPDHSRTSGLEFPYCRAMETLKLRRHRSPSSPKNCKGRTLYLKRESRTVRITGPRKWWFSSQLETLLRVFVLGWVVFQFTTFVRLFRSGDLPQRSCLRITEYSDNVLRVSKHSMDSAPLAPTREELGGGGASCSNAELKGLLN